MLTFHEYLEFVRLAYIENMDWRLGQTYFNVLAEHRQDLSEKVRTQPLDPFHNDGVIPEFLEWLQENW